MKKAHRHPLPQTHRCRSYSPPKRHGLLKADEIAPYVPPEWTPPGDYEYIARHYMTDSEEYLAKCRKWLADNAPPPKDPPPPKPVIDTELVATLYARHCPHVPPIDELIPVLKAAGVPEHIVEQTEKIRRRNMSSEIQTENQNWIDVMFKKWPSASKPTPKTKPPPRVIKAVKKKISILDA